MGKETEIQYCDSTINPTEGCDGCELWVPGKGVKICYAGRLQEMWHGAGAFDQVDLMHGRMEAGAKWPDLAGAIRPEKPWLDGWPRVVFVSDMSDALSKRVQFPFLKREIIEVVRDWPHLAMWFTKRPQRMAELSDSMGGNWPANLMAVTSVTRQRTADARIPWLLKVGGPKTVRGISVEPIWEPINLKPWLARLDWVATGGESGRAAEPCNPDWIGGLISDCREAGVPLFVKQLGSGFGLKDSKGGDWNEWPEDLRVRQMPRRLRETRASMMLL